MRLAPVPRQYCPRSIMHRTLGVLCALLLCVTAHGEAGSNDGLTEEQAAIGRTKAWRACITRTVAGDRYKCSLDAHGRGRVLV